MEKKNLLGQVIAPWLALVSVFTLSISAIGYLYYRHESDRIRQQKYEEIAAVAHLKIGQLVQWRQEMLADVRRSSRAPFFSAAVAEWLKDRQNQTLTELLKKRLSMEQEVENLADVLLVDPEQRILLSASAQPIPVNPAEKETIAQVMASGTEMLTDLYLSAQGVVLLDAIGAIRDDQGRPLAVLILRTNATSLLYPLIQLWPTPSKTAETLLVRREGDGLLFLNELRHQHNTALSLRQPLTLKDLPAVQAVLGKEGKFFGKDYRGVEVMADLQPVPGSPWFMVAKVDAHEILAELRYRGGIVLLFVSGFIVLAGSITALAYRHRQARVYRELYQSERERRAAQEEFRITLYSIGDAVITTDTSGHVKQMNHTAEKLTGWPESEARGRPIEEVFHIINEELGDAAENPVQRVLKEGTVVGLANHTVLLARDGTGSPIADSGAPIRDQAGNVIGVVLVFQDQTEERKAQKKIAESERRYRDLWEKAPVMMISLDSKGRTNFVSDLFCQELGYDRDEVIGKEPFLFQTEESADYARNVVFQSFLETGVVRDAPLQFVKSNGEIIEVLLNVTAERDESGKVIRSRSVFTDVTERNRAQRAIVESEARYADLYENAPDMYVSVDANTGEIIQCNQTVERVTGYSKQEIIGRKISEIYHPESIEAATKAFQAFKSEGELHNVELRLLCKDGSDLYVILNASGVYDESEKLAYSRSILRDITDRKRAEEALRMSEERLRLAQEAAKAGTWEWDLSTNRNFWSEELWALYGLEPHSCEPSYEAWLGTVHSHDRAQAEKSVKEAAAKGIDLSVEWRTNDGKGGQRWLMSRGRPIPESSGRVTRYIGIVMDITERKRAEAALQESEKKFRLLYDEAPMPYQSLDEDGCLIEVNTAWLDALGYSRDEVIGRDFADFLTPGSRERFKETFPAFKLAGKVFAVEHEMVRKDHSVVNVSFDGRVSEGGDSRSLRTHCVFQDITGKKQAERALQESEQRYRAVFNTASVGIDLVDQQGRFLEVNSALANFLGYTAEELCQLTILDVTYPDDLLKSRTSHEAVVGGEKESYRLEKRYLRKDGTIRWADTAVSVILDAGGNYRATVGVIRDITQYKKSEQARIRLASAVEQAAEAVEITDPLGTIVYVNPAFERITGYSSQEAVGNNPSILKSGHHDSDFYKNMWDTIACGNTWTGRLINKKKDGTLFEEDASISPVKGESGQIINYVAVKRDATKEAALQRQLVHAQKMEAVGTLAGGVAHDFNNILQIALGYSDLLLGDEDLPRQYRADLQQIRESAKRGADLVQRLLTFSRKTEIKPRPLNLNRRITELLKMLERTVPKMIDIQVSLAENLTRINADPTQIDQVLMNLAVNARDAMPEGGTLRFETANVSLDEGYAKTHLGAKPGRYVLLIVSDSGSGMDKDTLDHIFEPFYTTKGVGEGTGLGLAMVHGVVTHHGGYIRCYSEPDKGTIFRIYLPALVSHEDTEETLVRKMPPRGSETVLLVDDEEFVLDFGSKILKKAGYTVITASNGVEALEIYRARPDDIKLIILDLIMPEMGGKQCLEALLAFDSSVRVVLASGYSVDGTTRSALAAGAKGFVSKPYDIYEMLEVVRSTLDAS